ncbi:NUDIX domain-containing protein [Spirulina sp. CS-785/01]|uniref:NUDIX domain-containing protein n=1 Tax=Spirulina sp. CS-785/01 TaxID=3021716 RepID=UPI0023312D32|nr:NUDIX domain-containing protein [Spirulina sp. CS-785/01]MDB9315320.1 NUDIX domain-containing protein [Spirulina sp. CS-785/01]
MIQYKSILDETWYQRPANTPESYSAGGVIFRPENEQILVALVRNDQKPEYVLPKGHLEGEETPEEAARREIEEEAGLTELNLLGKLGIRERLNYSRTYWKITHYFLYSTQQKYGTPTESKFTLHWHSVEELPEFFWREQRELVQFAYYNWGKYSG